LFFSGESRRIVAAGGWVEYNRVNGTTLLTCDNSIGLFQILLLNFNFLLSLSIIGNLALSRALGDFAFKRNSKKPPEEQVVTGTFFYTLLSPQSL